jgi:hypothetical protein
VVGRVNKLVNEHPTICATCLKFNGCKIIFIVGVMPPITSCDNYVNVKANPKDIIFSFDIEIKDGKRENDN